MDIKEFKKNAMRDALDKVHSWKNTKMITHASHWI